MVTYSKDELKNLDYSSFQLTKDIWALVKPYKWKFFLASIIRLSGDLANLVPFYAFASIVTSLSKYKIGDSLSNIYFLLLITLGAFLIRNSSQFFTKYLGFQIAEKVSVDSSLKTIRHMFLLDMSWHEKENSGNKIKRIENAGNGLNKIIRLYFDNVIEIIVNLFAINFIIYQFDHNVLFCLLVFLFTYFICSYFMM